MRFSGKTPPLIFSVLALSALTGPAALAASTESDQLLCSSADPSAQAIYEGKPGPIVIEGLLARLRSSQAPRPDISLDGGLLDLEQKQDSVVVSFSNECDNLYTFTFKNEDLEALTTGGSKTLTASLFFFNAFEEMESHGGRTLQVECSLR
jgi:hypothetical protein